MNERNLIPAAHKLTLEEQSRGGKESVKSRARKKNTKQKLKLLLELPCHDNNLPDIAAFGVEYEDIDNEMVMLVSLFQKACTGDVQAVKEIYNILGKDNAGAELALRKRELQLKEAAAKSSAPASDSEMPLLYKALEEEDT